MCKAFVLVLSDMMVPTVALLGHAQLSNDPSPSYCTTGFCTSNKWHFFPWLYMELNELSKIAAQHRPLASTWARRWSSSGGSFPKLPVQLTPFCTAGCPSSLPGSVRACLQTSKVQQGKHSQSSQRWPHLAESNFSGQLRHPPGQLTQGHG